VLARVHLAILKRLFLILTCVLLQVSEAGANKETLLDTRAGGRTRGQGRKYDILHLHS